MKREANFQVYLKQVALGETTGFKAGLVRLLMFLLEPVYLVLLQIDHWLSRPKRFPVPVVSIGNLVAGGTGKTPLVVWMVKYLHSLGKKPAVLTRGYGSQGTADSLIFSFSDLENLTPTQTGDEPYLLASLLPDTLIGVGKDRYQTGLKVLEQEPRVDCLVLDDAFQYWRLDRDLDVVLLDACRPFGNRRLIPRGFLREPLTALKRAAVVLLTRTNLASSLELSQLKKEIWEYNPAAIIADVQIAEATLGKMNQEDSENSAVPAPDFLKGRRVAAVCAIGNPQQFFATLQNFGAQLGFQKAYSDHYPWGLEETVLLAEAVRNEGCSQLIVTAKDAVKLAVFAEVFQRYGIECLILSLDFNVTDRGILDRLRLIFLERGA